MEWRKNRIAVGAVVLAGLFALTLWAVNRDAGEARRSESLPDLELDQERITTLEITRPQGETVVLTEEAGTWQLVSPLGAEADENNVETALNRLGELKIARIAATQPENYERLQVDDGNAVRVVVKEGDETVAELAIGKYAEGMTMLRVEGRTEVFGASGSLRYAFDRALKAWRNRRVVDVESNDVRSIRFESPNGSFQFAREGDGWTVSQGAKALGEYDPKKVTAIVSTAARLVASDFASEEVSAARAGLAEPSATVEMSVTDAEEPIVLELGDRTETQNDVYLRRKGNPIIYRVSEYLANRLRPGPAAFAKSEEPEPPPTTQAVPQDQGQPKLPPEIMRQLQEQIRAQQQQQR